jgi:hypothetical protein
MSVIATERRGSCGEVQCRSGGGWKLGVLSKNVLTGLTGLTALFASALDVCEDFVRDTFFCFSNMQPLTG